MSKYTSHTYSSTRPSQAIEDSKKKTSLLKDKSWIRKPDDEDEAVDRDPNYGKSVLSGYRSSDVTCSEPEEVKSTRTIGTSSSVQALTKRFSGSHDELGTSYPTSRTTSSYTKSSYSSVTPDSPTTITTSKTTFVEEPKTSTKTTTVSKDGKTTETTITTSVRTSGLKTSSSSETFTERVKSSSKGTLYSSYSPTKTSKLTERTVTSTKDAEDKLYDKLIPSAIKDNASPTDSKRTVTTTETVTVKSSDDSKAEDYLYDTLIPRSIRDDVVDSKTLVSSTETVTVKSSPDGDGVKTTTTTRTSSSAADDLYDTLRSRSLSSDVSSPVRGESPTLTSSTSTRTISYSSYADDVPTTNRTTSYSISTKPSDDYSSDRKSYSFSRPDSSYEYTSISSPTTYTSTSYRSSSRSDDILADPIYSKSSVKSSYASPERTVLEKDLCTFCRKPFTGDAKMVLEDMNINCHASCFKCDVCNGTLAHLKAGDGMWVYKGMVHCENCFETTRDKWRR